MTVEVNEMASGEVFEQVEDEAGRTRLDGGLRGGGAGAGRREPNGEA